MKTDLIIIGSGPGGYETAAYAARQGLQVTIIEEKLAGGTCLNCGCIPTKSLVHDAEKAMGKANGQALFQAAIERKDNVVTNLRQGVEAMMHQPGINIVHGHATFKNSHCVAVDEEDFEAEHIIIATGSTPKLPPIPGLGGDGQPVSPFVVTSEELLTRKELPHDLCIIGAGVIGLEMASVFSAFGCKVTVVEFLKECLPTMDSEIARRLRRLMEKQGVKFYMGSAVQSIDNNKVIFKDTKKGTMADVEADVILVATGRKPCTKNLNIEAIGLEAGPKGIVTNENMQTNLPHIYAVGDVNGRQMLAHAATFQGYRAINHILGNADNIRLDIMPAAVFTHPEAASVGPTEDVCKANNMTYTTRKAIYRANGRAQAIAQTEGLVKLIFDENNRVIACHALGVDAAYLTQEISALMNFNITRLQLSNIIHIHPTLSEILLDASR
ncbi:MAG: dihydrolipoyl dehydrogenase [Prevotella sp.]|jgi:dihydrolipoamide dehydrogenase